MPQVFKVGSYWIYFWTSEGDPLEPVHVHISEGAPSKNSTKVWITQSGKTYLANNNSQIAPKTLRNIMRIIEARSSSIVEQWIEYFGSARFYC